MASPELPNWNQINEMLVELNRLRNIFLSENSIFLSAVDIDNQVIVETEGKRAYLNEGQCPA